MLLPGCCWPALAARKWGGRPCPFVIQNKGVAMGNIASQLKNPFWGKMQPVRTLIEASAGFSPFVAGNWTRIGKAVPGSANSSHQGCPLVLLVRLHPQGGREQSPKNEPSHRADIQPGCPPSSTGLANPSALGQAARWLCSFGVKHWSKGEAKGARQLWGSNSAPGCSPGGWTNPL